MDNGWSSGGPFGVDRDAVMDMLRELCDKTSRGLVVMQAASASQKTDVDNWPIQSITLEFVELTKVRTETIDPDAVKSLHDGLDLGTLITMSGSFKKVAP